MILARRAAAVSLTLLLVVAALEVSALFGTPGFSGYVAPAEARVGRPVTPVSVAGVARRTVRRCAVGVYYC
jgi:hypothetical protein